MQDELPHVLVVDDDTRLRELLSKYLSENGFRVTVATDAVHARAMLDGLAFDVMILDVMMPGENGIELTRSLRGKVELPILLLTAMGEPDDRIDGLEAGAEDYLTKPFEPRELVLRLRTILRRGTVAPVGGEVKFGVCVFDLEREELRRGELLVRLTTVEASLLRTFALNAGVTLSRDELIHRSRIAGEARTVDVQINRLRRKIEADPRLPQYLQTVRGEGYVLHLD